ncbi:MAG TPA: efflux RND transporter periplasmic adaptor subunit [Puia sp.]|nr:efflux RND transporter periplasmic adaptor subunit [Puia sp.]
MNKLAFSLGLLGSVLTYSCQQKQPPRNPPTPVNLLTVSSKQVLYYDNYPATTEALSQVDLRPEVQGYVTGIFFSEGSYVKKGQKLYEIDERLYKAAYDQAVANVRVAQGNLEQAEQDAKRYEYLIQHNAVAKQTLDHAEIAKQNAQNEVNAAQQAQKTAATNLTYSVITAPFNGTIGFSQVKLGNLVTVGTTILTTVSTDDPMAVDFLINEAQLQHYQELERNKQKHIDSLFTIILSNSSIYSKDGKISVIDRAVNPQTGTVRIRLVFDNPEHELRAGMSCVLRVRNQDAKPQIVVPGKSVVEQMGEFFVFVAKDTVLPNTADSAAKKQDGHADDSTKLRAFQKKVQPGQTIGANVIIKSGINDGDKIVVDGVQALHEGSEISVSSKSTAGNKKTK